MSQSTRIADTTKAQRIAIIRQWIPQDTSLEDCDIDLWEFYDDYIQGKRKLLSATLPLPAILGTINPEADGPRCSGPESGRR